MEVPPNPHCGARLKSRDGLCGNRAGFRTDHVGFGSCYLHGGATETGRKHAATLRQELFAAILEEAYPSLARMKALRDTAESESVQFQAAKDLLDRAGTGPKFVHEHSGPGGEPIPVEVRAAELLARARKFRAPAKKAAKRKRPAKP